MRAMIVDVACFYFSNFFAGYKEGSSTKPPSTRNIFAVVIESALFRKVFFLKNDPNS